MSHQEPQQVQDDDDSTDDEPEAPPVRMAELMQIMEFFPDVRTESALELLEEENNDVEEVLDRLVNMQGFYPKDVPQAAGTVPEPTSNAPKYDFMSPTSFVPSHRYKWQSVDHLVFRFPFLDARKTKALFEANHRKYAITHNAICQTILGTSNTAMELQDGRKFDELLLAVLFDKSSLKQDELALLRNIFKRQQPHSKRSIFLPLRAKLTPKHWSPRITCPILEEEIKHVQNEIVQLKLTLEKDIARRRARQASITAGEAMTCSCCYDEVAMDELVACRTEGHLFCEGCLSSYVENTIFGQGGFGVHPVTKEAATEILCCSGEGCYSGFDRFYLKKALPEKVLQKYDEIQAHMAIEQAGLRDNMYSCHNCEFMFEVPEEADFFACPMEGCHFEACRHCGEPPHFGKLCQEVEGARETLGRRRVEEAASNAVIRKCPSCRKGMMKTDGCNMITCPCRVRFCYCCNQRARTYRHFCQEPHCEHTDPPNTCYGKCPLYTNAEEDDKRAMREAASMEAANVESEALLIEDQHNVPWGAPRPKQTITIDVESILRTPRGS
ncbi:protein ligase RNF216 [Seminavis robusta]|uniref:Protein ligase RNF216 n=1 Tax=Seminavis robusta TaxID=568900 RepID=A0A9N8E0F1_9STRA|nr:protein ligase RNF216 [Seminavis robusta]|eukprot:Sro426_g140390.1 protein ligase RNF216 (555) ;mRNA; f:25544-27291